MKLKIFYFIISTFLATAFCFTPVNSYAEKNQEELLKKIEALQKRVDELEADKQSAQEDDSWGFYNRRRSRAWDPFAEMQRMQEEMSNMFQHSFDSRGWANGGLFSNQVSFNNDFNIKETDQGYELRLDMEGMDQEKVNIEINTNSVTVTGEHSRKDTNEGSNTYFSSQSYGSFMRTIPLPEDADTDKVKTEKEVNSLVVRIPKKK